MKSSSLLRNSVIFGAPLSYLVIGAIHPMDLDVGDDPGLYIGIHVAQLFSIWGMALMLSFLTAGIENSAARLARFAVLPYAIFYTAFDSIAGIAMGLLVHEANGMAAADQQAAQRLVELLLLTPSGAAFYVASGLTWLLAAGAAILSLRGRAPGGALALLLLGAAVFAVAHPFPPGPVGMTLFLVGLAWLQLGPKASKQPAAITPTPLPAARLVSS